MIDIAIGVLSIVFSLWSDTSALSLGSRNNYFTRPLASYLPSPKISFLRSQPDIIRITTLRALDDSADSANLKEEDRLLSLLGFIQNREPDRQVCGLDATEKEQELVAQVVAEVEKDSKHNLATQQNGIVEFKQLTGDWKLCFTNSRTMIINKSLSGLGRSESEAARFVSLVQKLSGSKYLGQAEFIEQFGQGEDGLQVSIPGEWFTKAETNYYTGQPTTTIEVDPDRVIYGPSNNNADDWSSLGPIKRCDLIYLSRDMMISRVNVNPEYFFVWQRIQ